MDQNQGQAQSSNKSKMNGNKMATTAMEMTPEGIQSYVQDTVKELTSSFNSATSGLKEYAQTGYDESIDYVKKHPGKSVLGGLGIGFILGAAFTAILSRRN
jgi:ElaB/YqjD/DUF883 family membrane-anchored ribosome-binding protein